MTHRTGLAMDDVMDTAPDGNPGHIAPMSDQIRLREKARDLLQTGKVPSRRPDRMWGGPGCGEQCILCNASMTQYEIVLEVEFTQEDGARPTSHHFHTRCFSAFEVELRDAMRGRRTSFVADQPESATAGPISLGLQCQEGTAP